MGKQKKQETALQKMLAVKSTIDQVVNEAIRALTGELGLLTNREVATIIHGLRIIQAHGRIEGCAAGMCEHFEEYEELSDEEIDALCEKINLDLKTADDKPEPEDESRYTNSYLCPNDQTRWDDDWSCMCNDRCPSCDAEIEPYATTDNSDGSEVIHNQEVYDKANSEAKKNDEPAK
jgi:hypothetical protein